MGGEGETEKGDKRGECRSMGGSWADGTGGEEVTGAKKGVVVEGAEGETGWSVGGKSGKSSA